MLSLRNVTKCFGAVKVLDDINLDVPKGSFVSLLGPSGCGKSTLLAIMAGLEQPTSGIVTSEGRRLQGPDARAGMIFQKDLLLDWKSALANVLLQFKMRGEPSASHVQQAVLLLERVGLGLFLDAYPRHLSGGMRQRVALCRALVHDPTLMLMDEPFGALDAITRERVAIDVADLTAQSDRSVVLVTHSIEEAVFLGDIVYVLSARPGRLSARIAIDIPRPRREWPRGSSPFTPYIEEAFAALQRAGAYDDAA